MPFELELLSELDMGSELIIVDGGIDNLSSLYPIDSHQNYILVGDNDSTTNKKHQFSSQFKKDKNFSDFEGALEAIAGDYNTINCFGFLGGRKDHEYINIATSHRYLLDKEDMIINFENKVKVLSMGEYKFSHHELFSLLSFSETDISMNGDISYPYSGSLKKLSAHGLSNKAFGEFIIKTTSPLVIFF